MQRIEYKYVKSEKTFRVEDFILINVLTRYIYIFHLQQLHFTLTAFINYFEQLNHIYVLNFYVKILKI